MGVGVGDGGGWEVGRVGVGVGWVMRAVKGRVGGGGGWVSSWRRVIPFIRIQTAVLCLQLVPERDSIHRTGQDSHWQQFGTTHILINAIHWPHRPYSAPQWFDRVDNKPSVKADLTIYSYVFGIFR